MLWNSKEFQCHHFVWNFPTGRDRIIIQSSSMRSIRMLFYDQSGGHGLRSDRQVIVTGGLSFELAGLWFVLSRIFRFMFVSAIFDYSLRNKTHFLTSLPSPEGFSAVLSASCCSATSFCFQFNQFIQSRHMKWNVEDRNPSVV